MSMIRKLVKHGPSTLIASLPASWVKKMGLRSKDEVRMTERENQLIISLEKIKKKESITVNITNLDRTSLIYFMHALYRQGFSNITFVFDEPETTHFRKKKKITFSKIIHTFINRFIGFEISKESKSRIEISQVSYIDKEEIDNMINRTFILFLDMVKSFCNGIRENNHLEISKMDDQHDSITKLISFLLRAIHRGEYKNKAANYPMQHILANVDKIIDIIKYVSRYKLEHKEKISADLLPLIDIFEQSFSEYVSLFRKYDEKMIRKISEKRDQFKHQLKEMIPNLKPHEISIASSLTQALELLFDLMEWRMHLWVLSSSI